MNSNDEHAKQASADAMLCAGILFFCPLVLKELLGGEASPSLLAILTTVPFGLSALLVWLNARHSRITGVLHCVCIRGPFLHGSGWLQHSCP